MFAHATAGPAHEAESVTPFIHYQAIDLLVDPEHGGYSAAVDLDAETSSLRDSPCCCRMGYRISPSCGDLEPGMPSRLSIVIALERQGQPQPHSRLEPLSPVGCSFRTQMSWAGDLGFEPGAAAIRISPKEARIDVDEPTWRSQSDSILLAICQAWRFQSIDDQLNHWIRNASLDQGYTSTLSLAMFHHKQRLQQLARQVRGLSLAFLGFQGPLIDPLAYCSTKKSARAYKRIAEGLNLRSWSATIEARLERLERTYEAVNETAFHTRFYAWEIGLELLILLVLSGEAALHLWGL
jgi:hypothetical protein